MYIRFNTASGKHCCNANDGIRLHMKFGKVSIPQAVSTVATLISITKNVTSIGSSFNTASGKHCCNDEQANTYTLELPYTFQYRKR